MDLRDDARAMAAPQRAKDPVPAHDALADGSDLYATLAARRLASDDFTTTHPREKVLP